MIGLDTNLLVRLLIKDDEPQARLVERLLERCQEEEEKCLISLIVLCELEWVLSSCYKATRSQIVSTVEGLLAEAPFIVEEAGMVRRALEQYRQGRGDLSDYLLGARCRALGAGTTYTFDRALGTSSDFTLLKNPG